jgi:hypothetical protein
LFCAVPKISSLYQSGAISAAPSLSQFETVVEAAVATEAQGFCTRVDVLDSFYNAGTCSGRKIDIAFKLTAVFRSPSLLVWDFDLNVDFGWGGKVLIDGHVKREAASDMWWAGNLQKAQPLDVEGMLLSTGWHTLVVYGAENCCDGRSGLRFRVAGGEWLALTQTNLASIASSV